MIVNLNKLLIIRLFLRMEFSFIFLFTGHIVGYFVVVLEGLN